MNNGSIPMHNQKLSLRSKSKLKKIRSEAEAKPIRSKNNRNETQSKASKKKSKFFYRSSFSTQRKYPSSLYKSEDEPFHLIVLKVGSTLLVLALFCYGASFMHSRSSNSPTNIRRPISDSSTKNIKLEKSIVSTPPWNNNSTLKHITSLDDTLFAYDVFGLYNMHVSEVSSAMASNEISDTTFWNETSMLIQTYLSQYGGIDAGRYLLQNAIKQKRSQQKSSIHDIARRLALAKIQNRPFRIGFTGYNALTGRGNFHSDSYSFGLQQLLEGPMRLSGLSVEIINVGMANISPFPYGWCLNEMLNHEFVNDDNKIERKELDVLGIDFSRNEQGFEPFLRNAASLFGNPIIILRDKAISKEDKQAITRERVFKKYIDLGVIPKSSFISYQLSSSVLSTFLSLQPQSRPPGFQMWDEYNAPATSQIASNRNNPTAQQHDLIAWTIAMHFLAALQYMVSQLPQLLEETHRVDSMLVTKHLPPPITNMSWYNPLLYGRPHTEFKSSTNATWIMPYRRCFTTFVPLSVISEGNLLENEGNGNRMTNLVITGAVAYDDDVDLYVKKGPMFYNKGWVLDTAEETKQLHNIASRMEYEDKKIGYFGVKHSGKLVFFLPIESIRNGIKEGDNAYKHFRSLTICGLNDSRGYGSCDMSKDIAFRLDGIESQSVNFLKDKEISYLGNKVCVDVDVPKDSLLKEGRKDKNGKFALSQIDGGQTTSVMERNARIRGNKFTDGKNEAFHKIVFGVLLEIEIINPKVMFKTGPCSISHILFEEF